MITPLPRTKNRRASSIVYLMTFIMGGCGIAYEYTFSKISSDLLGNSVHQWAITIGLMMLFMGIGSDLQKHIEDKGIFDKFIFFEVLLGIIGAFGPVLMLYTFGNFRDHYVLVQYGSTVAVGFLIGLEIPILSRINEEFAPELKVNLGGILRMDYVGAFAGALAWVFILPRFFSLTQMSFVLGVLNLSCALLALAYFYRMAVRKIALTVLTLASTLALCYGLIKAPVWTAHAEQQLFQDPIIYAATTRYQHVVLTQAASGDVYCYINGNTQFSSFDEHIYHEMLVHPAMLVATRRDRVLILGGGDGLALREVLKYPDVHEITLVDLDPGMTNLARENEALLKLNQGSLLNARVSVVDNGALIDSPDTQTITTPRRTGWFAHDSEKVAEVSLVNIDASLFVDQISGSYDVIIVDFPDPNNLELSKLYSRGFYGRLRDKLNRNGIMVQQSTSPVGSREAFLCIGRTLADAGFHTLPYHDNVPTFGEWGFWLAARDDFQQSDPLERKLVTIEDIPVPVRYITPDVMRASFVFGKDTLTSSETSVNSIINNVIFQYYADALTY